MKIRIHPPKRRVTWKINPVSRIKPSKKRYSRTGEKASLRASIQEHGA